MQAIVMEQFGPPEVLILRDVADPPCGAGQMVIEVSFSSVTFVETQVRSGRAPHVSMLPRLPAVPGNGVAGVVVAVGAGLGNDVIGTRVVSTTRGTGGYAQLVSVPANGIIPIPDEVALADAAALLADGRTALGLLDRAMIEPGATVLVEAAAGGVGSLLVQLAKRAGAFVVAAAGDERKLELARSLGADVAADYRRSSWTNEVVSAMNGAKLDVVFDGVGGSIGREAFELLGPGGRLCVFGMASGSFTDVSEHELTSRGITQPRGSRPSTEEMSKLTARALAGAAAGTLRPVIGQKVPLARAADAHRAIEGRATIGKTLLMAS
ncbi:MAG TPA: zinc-binding dehydrogenase [Solirubrobacteraceae bacterium]|jgi:NADPH2:quinone reductase